MGSVFSINQRVLEDPQSVFYFKSNMMEAKFRTDKLQNGNCDTTDNFVSPNTTDFKTQTSHPVRFKNTAS